MDLHLIQRLLYNLLKVSVIVYRNPQDLEDFHNLFSFHREVNLVESPDLMREFLSTLKEGIIYEYSDNLGITVNFILIDHTPILIGPYIKSNPAEEQLYPLLLQNKIPINHLQSLRHYLSNLTIISSYLVSETINNVLQSFNPLYSEYHLHRLKSTDEQVDHLFWKHSSVTNYDDIYQRYEIENRFMDMITTGNVAAVQAAFADIVNFNSNLPSKDWRNVNTALYTTLNGIVILRILARKAAEKSGLSVIIIDDITQRNAQKLKLTASNIQIATRENINMIIELTQAVHDYLTHTKNYSPLTTRAIDYLFVHYAEDCSLATLAKHFSVSPSHLSRQFKKETGENLSNYVAKFRCEHAERLLRTTNLPIASIGELVGYLDNNYFVKVFKKYYSQTPSSYRSTINS
ncbi:AraC family transcriptional regulator [Streptococcus plurextorum]|uniref:AraC family transcriptional regulator n=1 Tax=Streptococcus plurextorum TaxID=456876 RepID=UPI0004203882|nr:AraC family transcriptional regulator [Streptococcus plurextorum]